MVRCRVRSCLVVLAGVMVAMTLSGCRVDVTVDVEMAEDGSGTLTLTLAADAEVVEQAGGLAEDLRFDDLVTAGWEVGAPVPTEEGGLRLALRHPFDTPEELTALLASLNGTDGPFKTVSFTRLQDEVEIVYTVTGTGRVDAGLASFADADLVATVGATPYADDVAAAGLSQSEAVVITLRVDLPGDVQRTTATAADGVLTWVIPLDSRPVDLTTVSALSLERGGPWSVAAGILQVVFVAWVVLAALLLAYLPVARRRRTPRPLPARHPAASRRGRATPAWEDDWYDPRHGDDGNGNGRNDIGDDTGDDMDGNDRPPTRPTFPRPNF